MIIEHDGKKLDTEREIRRITGKGRAKYIGVLTGGRHVIECVDDERFGAYFPCHVVEQFENIPQKHVRWYAVRKDYGYDTEAEAQRVAVTILGVVAKAEWEE